MSNSEMYPKGKLHEVDSYMVYDYKAECICQYMVVSTMNEPSEDGTVNFWCPNCKSWFMVNLDEQ